MRTEFQTELDRLEAILQEEGDLVARALRDMLEALGRQDPVLAEQVIAFDDQVDERFLAIDRGVELLLATQAPVAGDLRLALSMLHINLHLERMADQCVTVAKMVRLVQPTGIPEELIDEFQKMGARAEQMIRVAMDSFAMRDVKRAESLMELDNLIDVCNRALSRRIIELGGDERQLEAGLRAILISRCLERIGDNAVDIGEQTAFLVTGSFREFTDASHPNGEPNIDG
jgi:phosphate transport system protein